MIRKLCLTFVRKHKVLVNTIRTENSLNKIEFEAFRNNIKITIVISVHFIKELVNLKAF